MSCGADASGPAQLADGIATKSPNRWVTWCFGGGADLEIYPSAQRFVPVLRLQVDWVNPKEARACDAYGRVTFGLSFRFEARN